jgi:hypothetical protein
VSELSNMKTDPDLGRESLNGDSLPPQSTRPTHPGFAGLDATEAYVLGTDGNLWLENAPWGTTVPPSRQHVDGNVAAVQALSATQAYVLGTDGNLWLENAPWGTTVPPSRQHVDGNVSIRRGTSITYNHSVDLGADAGHIAGPVNLTIMSDGSYNFSGRLNNNGVSSYTVNVIVAAVSTKGVVFTFAGSQSIGSGVVGGLFGGSNNWNWDNTGNNAQIKENWADLVGGVVQYQGTADSDMGAIWNTLVSDIQSALQDIEGALPTIEEVIQIVGDFAILLA